MFIITTELIVHPFNNDKYGVGDWHLESAKCIRNVTVYMAVFSHKKSPVVTRLFK